MEIGADFGHNDRTSEDMANRRLPFDLQRLIGLHTSQNGVLTVVLPFVGNRGQFWLLLQNQRRYDQSGVTIGFLASPRPVYLLEWHSNCSFTAIRHSVRKTRKLGPILAITAEPVKIWPIGGHH